MSHVSAIVLSDLGMILTVLYFCLFSYLLVTQSLIFWAAFCGLSFVF